MGIAVPPLSRPRCRGLRQRHERARDARPTDGRPGDSEHRAAAGRAVRATRRTRDAPRGTQRVCAARGRGFAGRRAASASRRATVPHHPIGVRGRPAARDRVDRRQLEHLGASRHVAPATAEPGPLGRPGLGRRYRRVLRRLLARAPRALDATRGVLPVRPEQLGHGHASAGTLGVRRADDEPVPRGARAALPTAAVPVFGRRGGCPHRLPDAAPDVVPPSRRPGCRQGRGSGLRRPGPDHRAGNDGGSDGT